jgi:cutinase
MLTRQVFRVATGRAVAVGLVLVGIAMLAVLFNIPGSTSVEWPDQACTGALVVGLRGNGDAGGMGGDTLGVVDHLLPKLQSRLSTAAVPFPYDTGPLVEAGGHIKSGSQALVRVMTARHENCPNEQWVLIGQSEGAAIVHRSLASLPDQVAAVVLLADPTWISGARYNVAGITGYGVISQPLFGADAGFGPITDDVPAGMAGRVRSYCLRGDPACDFNFLALLNGARVIDIHTSYRSHSFLLEDAATFAASNVR